MGPGGLVPTWIDNAYRQENRTDNPGILRRVASPVRA